MMQPSELHAMEPPFRSGLTEGNRLEPVRLKLLLLTLLLALIPFSLTAVSTDQKVIGYVSAGDLPWRVISALRALGDRLEKPGKERITLTGLLTRGNNRPLAVTLWWEYPGHLRIEYQTTQRVNIAKFDGTVIETSGAIQDGDAALLGTLLLDSPEQFVMGESEGLATRFLGSGFRAQNDKSKLGPTYDIFQVMGPVLDNGQVEWKAKNYHINSLTHLLERVTYWTGPASSSTKVEVLLTDWGPLYDQRFPGRISRTENNVAVFTLVIASGAVGPKSDDGLFGP